MKKVVLRLDLHDDKAKKKAMKCVSTLSGIDSIAIDMKQQQLTVIGTVDPVDVVTKLRKFWQTQIISVGPAKEPEKKEEPKKEEAKKEEPKKEEPKKEEPKKEEPKKEEPEKKEETVKQYSHEYVMAELMRQYPHMVTHYHVQSSEENPNACVIS